MLLKRILALLAFLCLSSLSAHGDRWIFESRKSIAETLAPQVDAAPLRSTGILYILL
jgi:hypothetical protein